jgi:hypothetical protein
MHACMYIYTYVCMYVCMYVIDDLEFLVILIRSSRCLAHRACCARAPVFRLACGTDYVLLLMSAHISTSQYRRYVSSYYIYVSRMHVYVSSYYICVYMCVCVCVCVLLLYI